MEVLGRVSTLGLQEAATVSGDAQIRTICGYTLPRYAQSPPLLFARRPPRHDHSHS